MGNFSVWATPYGQLWTLGCSQLIIGFFFSSPPRKLLLCIKNSGETHLTTAKRLLIPGHLDQLALFGSFFLQSPAHNLASSWTVLWNSSWRFSAGGTARDGSSRNFHNVNNLVNNHRPCSAFTTDGERDVILLLGKEKVLSGSWRCLSPISLHSRLARCLNLSHSLFFFRCVHL